jgi:TolB-like protein/Flp pilus assembly protein TadD
MSQSQIHSIPLYFGQKKEATINLSHFLGQLVAETRRRKVVPVVITYAVVGWLILQVAGQTFEPLGLPEWGIQVLIVAIVACFPAVIFLTWLVDFKQQGIMFDLPLWRGDTESPIKQKKSSQLFAILLCVLVTAGTGALIIYLLGQLPKSSKTVTETVTETKTSEYPVNSIAVMAFRTFDGHTDSDYFSAGLAEEILNFLAAMKEMNVAARTSSFRFREKQLNIREIAKLLNVKHILEGSVRREGDRIRVTVQLIDGVEGYHEWSKSYDRKLDSIFAIQLEIAAAVVNELKISLSLDSESILQETPAENIEAYIFYLQGREKLHSSQDADVMMTAKKLFNQALKIDQSYAKAYAGICAADLRLYQISNDPDDFESAEEACDQAKRLSNSLSSDIQVVLGRLYRYRGWYQKAVNELNSVIRIAPTSPDAYIELGEVLSAQNKVDEAEAAFLRAVDLKRNYWKAHEALANFYYVVERYSDSAKAYEIVTRLTPDVAGNFAAKGAVYYMLGDMQKALVAYERSLQLKPSRLAYTNIGSFYYYLGQFDAAVKMQKLALEYAPDDHRVLGRLAESYRFIPGKESESRSAYERAAELALDNLKINSEDWSTRGALGVYYAHLDRFKEAIELLELAVNQSQRHPEVLYLQALVFLKVDKSKAALTLLEEAVKLEGVYRQFIAADPDLQILKENERFIQLLPAKIFTG